jgi:uncharacterized protein
MEAPSPQPGTHDVNRIVLLDAFRGYALMGLFLLHMVEYFELLWVAPARELALGTRVTFWLFGGKAYALFAFLFGVSFFVILRRGAVHGRDLAGRFFWRVALLLVIGYMHGLLYSGDVLQVLAVAGFLLVPLRKAPFWLLVFLTVVLLLQVPSFVFTCGLGASEHAYVQPFFVAQQAKLFPVYLAGTGLEVIRANAFEGTLGKWLFMLESGRFSTIIGASLLGFLSARAGFFVNARFSHMYVRSFCACVLLASGIHVLESTYATLPHPQKAHWVWMSIWNAYFNTTLAACSVFCLALLNQYEVPRAALSVLAAPGRLTLSLYVGQSLIFVPLFYPWGLGAYHWLGAGGSLGLGVVFWGVQVILARWWIARFYHGPLEWCWRVATLRSLDVPFFKPRRT